MRNGTHRRMEKERRRMKDDAKHSRDSSDYEETDEDMDYYPEPKGVPVKKKRKRGRPPRHEKRDDEQPSKVTFTNSKAKELFRLVANQQL